MRPRQLPSARRAHPHGPRQLDEYLSHQIGPLQPAGQADAQLSVAGAAIDYFVDGYEGVEGLSGTVVTDASGEVDINILTEALDSLEYDIVLRPRKYTGADAVTGECLPSDGCLVHEFK